MESLADIFRDSGDKEEEQKYRKKIAIVKENQLEKAAYLEKRNAQAQPSTEDSIKRVAPEKESIKKSKIKRLK